MPEISIVIPVYNGAPYLAHAIDSVRAQTLRDWRLVIVDDGSTDASGMIAQTYASIDGRIRVVRQPNGGVAVARNRGSAEADIGTAAYTFLDADDYWQPSALREMSAYLASHSNSIAVHGLVRYINAAGAAVRPGEGERLSRERYVRTGMRLRPDPSAGSLTFATLVRRNVILSSGSVLIRGSAMRRVGRFDQSIAPVADWDMWLRLSTLGEIGLLNSLVLNYRQHGASMSQNSDRMLSASRVMFCKHLATPGYTAEQALLLRIGRRYLRLYALAQRSVLFRRTISQRKWSEAIRQLYQAMGELM